MSYLHCTDFCGSYTTIILTMSYFKIYLSDQWVLQFQIDLDVLAHLEIRLNSRLIL